MNPPSHQQLISAIHYDPETGLFTKPGQIVTAGHEGRGGYLMINTCKHIYRAHRIAWLYMTGEWPCGEIDHINGNKQDNRFSNLRICTHQQNNHNQAIRRNNTSGVKGVYWSKVQRKWRGQVCLNYQVHHTEAFEDIRDAEMAVRSLRERLHGEFANHG